MSWKIVSKIAEAIKVAGPPIRIVIELEEIPIINHKIALEALEALITYSSKVAPYITAVVPREMVVEIAKLPWVKRVWDDPVMELMEIVEPMAATTVSLIESAKQIGIDVAKSRGYTGKGVPVGLVDSGVNKIHPMLEGKVIAGKHFAGSDPGDRNGHGTWCASCVAGNRWESPVGTLEGIASGAVIINAKAFEGSRASASTLMAALEWACEAGAVIVSNSWGGKEPYEPLEDLINRLITTYRVIMVFSAGNRGPGSGTVGYPGGYTKVVGVGSIAVKVPEPNSITTFSSRGPNAWGDIKPDIMAPGGNASPDECIYAAGLNGGVACYRGTSMAAPHITGCLAILIEVGYPDPVDVLYSTALDIDVSGKDNNSGFGVVDMDKATSILPKHILTIDTTLGGTTEPTPASYEYDYGATATVRAIPESGYRFIHWILDGVTRTENPISFTMDRNYSLTANFEAIPIPTHTISVDSEPQGVTFLIDTMEQTTPFVATLDEGTYTVAMPEKVWIGGSEYKFIQWKDGSTNPTRYVELTKDVSIKAMYSVIVPTGIITISTTPVEGEIFIDGESVGIGEYSERIKIGTYTVSFGDVEGYLTPEPQSAVVKESEETNVIGIYNVKPPFELWWDALVDILEKLGLPIPPKPFFPPWPPPFLEQG